MKAHIRSSAFKRALLLLLLTGVLLALAACGANRQIVIEGDFADGTVLEYTGQTVQFPVAHVENGLGRVLSYDVLYTVVSLSDGTEVSDEYAAFDLPTGAYRLVYTDASSAKVTKSVSFEIRDTTGPTVSFLEVPNGLFLQDITADTVNKLPLYSIEDASTAEGIELTRVLKFRGEGDEDFVQCDFRKINNSYEITAFGVFRYELTATDIYGNETFAAVEWKVKDRDWLPDELPGDGILADYSSEGYCNLIESGDANQYYKIGNDYTDEWLAEFEGAEGVLKLELSFNNSVGWGNNTIRLRLPKTYSQKDLAGKYLAVRIYVEGEHIKSDFLFAGNMVQFWAEDSTTRALNAGITGLETGKWMTFYIDADTAQHIGMYPNSVYNPVSTFYEGGDPSDALQLCFHRDAGYYNNMTLYIDSVSIAEFLPDTELTVSGKQASWTAVKGAVGYLVNINGQEQTVQGTSIDLPGQKGYIRVTPLGNGVTTLNAQTVTGVYGLSAGDKLAAFDDALYVDLFTDILRFSTEAEHSGYKPKSLTGTLTADGVKLDIGTSSWAVVTGVRFQFPNPQSKGSNTTLVMNMLISNNDYGDHVRVYDYNGTFLGTIETSDENVGKFHKYELDISAYEGTLTGIQLIFGPNSGFTVVPGGVSVTFKEMYLENTYYPITVDGQSLTCAGSRKLIAGYTASNLVQFTSFYNFGVPADDTPLSFSGTVLLDGKQQTAVTVVGYPNTDTICFKLPHEGKVLTILKDSVIYYGGIAVKVEETFNVKWDGTSWQAVSTVPSAPATQYVTLADGSVKTVESSIILTPGFTSDGVVQFTDVYNFGLPADDTPLGFEGTVMLDGALAASALFVGYPNNTTIALKAPHQGCLLTILKGSVIYHGDTAVVVAKTFNAKWDGTSWQSVSTVPEVPDTQYVTLADGTTRTLIASVTLTPGFTLDSLVQFSNIYDFGAPADSTPIGFEGTVLLQGRQVESPSFNAYLNSTTIGLEKLNHTGKVVTITEGSLIYNDTDAIRVKTTFNAVWDGTSWTSVDEIPEPEEPQEGTLELQYRYGTATLIQLNTNLPTSIPCADFLTSDNGCSIDESGNTSQHIGWVGMTSVDGTVILTLNFNAAFSAGQTYTLPAGSVFGFTDGSLYTLDEDCALTFDGTAWTAGVVEPTEPETPVEPEEPEAAVMTLRYRYGSAKLIQLNTDLPATVPCANFLATDNGCVIDQSSNAYQQVGWIAMEKVGSTIVLTFNFGASFSAGQTYFLPAGSVFGFTDGSLYVLDKDYTFTYGGSAWTMEATEPTEPEEPAEPEATAMTLRYRYGSATLIQLNTDLPTTVPCANFLATDNGCVIDQSSNAYQQVGWIAMEKVGSTIVLTFNFNASFSAGQTYFLPAGSVFGFTDGSLYVLDKDYTFTYGGSAWTMEATEPTQSGDPIGSDIWLAYRWGTSSLIQYNTNLPSTTPIANFLATDNGCSLLQSGSQQVGWIGMADADGTVVLTFNFNSAFSVGKRYTLSAGSVFGFTDGSSYTLPSDISLCWDGSVWSEATDE